MQWIRTAEPEIIKQVWIQAVEQKDLFWNNVHKFSPKNPNWTSLAPCFLVREGEMRPAPRATLPVKVALARLGTSGADPRATWLWFSLVVLAFANFAGFGQLLQKPIMNMFFCLQKRLRLPQVAMECHERIHTGCLWELWRNHKMKILMVMVMTTWRHGWIFFQRKFKQRMFPFMCFKPFTVSDSVWIPRTRTRRETVLYEKVTAQYAFEECCNLVIWESWFLIIAVIAVIAVIAC